MLNYCFGVTTKNQALHERTIRFPRIFLKILAKDTFDYMELVIVILHLQKIFNLRKATTQFS